MDNSHATFSERALYTLVLGAAVGAASMLAKRLVQTGWTSRRGTPPPKPLGLLKSLGGRTGAGAVKAAW